MKSYDKMQCAEHLLKAATRTYNAEGSCPAVVHLAGAAWDIAAAVSRYRQQKIPGETRILHDEMWRHNKELMAEVEDIRNWIKHADRDPESQLDWRGKRRGSVANASETTLHGAAIEIANASDERSEAVEQVHELLLGVAPKLAATLATMLERAKEAELWD